tara:strand:+ start:127 stop:282 length:156 start_codon:yes stop_codon:yes gene_type:complete
MKKIKDIVNSSWFKAAAIGGIGILLLLDKDIFYSGIAFGFAVREFLLSFKK